MKITIKDVAKEAKVSTSTVSRVLSNSDKISSETKEIVFAAIKKLNYRPNAIARSLAKKKRRMLGVVLPNEAQDLINNHFFIEAMKGMNLYAQDMNYYITYIFSKSEKDEAKHIQELYNSSLVDGICLLRAAEKDKTIKFLKERQFPFVIIGRPEEGEDLFWVDNDNFKASYNLTEAIIEKGIKNIAFLGSRETWNVTKDRLKGYQLGLETNGISYNPEHIFYSDNFSEEEGYKYAELILEKNKNIKAVFATDDLLAIGVLKYLREKNINDIIVTGFNNIPLATYQCPPLASVDINAKELGYMAVKLLIDSLEGIQNINKHYIVPCKFINRESFNTN